MGVQKYRFDRNGETAPNGATPVYTDWLGGPSLAGVRNCPCSDGQRRTVYTQGEADTFFSVPAAIVIKRKRHNGVLMMADSDKPEGYEFHIYQAVKDF